VPLVEIVAAALLAQAAAAPGSPGTGEKPPIHVEAPEATWDAASGTATLRGGFLLTRGTLRLRAPEGSYRPETGEVEVAGDALLVDGARAIVAKALRGEVGGVYEADAPSVFFVSNPRLLEQAKTPEEAARAARRLTLHADKGVGSAEGNIELTNARATLCNCPDGGAPSWEIRARSADVRPGERAILSWPVLWIVPRFLFVERPVPVLALPWLYVPLGERQTGLLLPEFHSSAATGSRFTLPLFVTLGRSADLTFTAGYDVGPSATAVRAGKPAVRGPEGIFDLRWAPAEKVDGRLKLEIVDDLDGEKGGIRGARVALSGFHSQPIGERGELRLGLALVGDPLYGRDFTSDVLQRGQAYRRSALLAARRGDDTQVELTGAWLVPLAPDGTFQDVRGLSFGTFGAGLPSFQRGPAIAGRLLPTPLPGGLLASGRAEIARFAPARGVTNDAGGDGRGPGDLGWSPWIADAGQLDGRWEPGERLAATRAMVRAGVERPLLVGRWLRLAPFVAGAASGYAFDADASSVAQAWGVAGVGVESELSRRFGEGFRHSIVPRLAWRLGSGVLGDPLPAFGYDQWDRGGAVPPGAAARFEEPRMLAAAPPGRFQQGRASIETRIGAPGAELLRAEVGQNVDLDAGRLGERFATLRGAYGLVAVDGAVRYASPGSRPAGEWATAPRPDGWTELRGALSVRSPWGQEVHASALRIGAGGSPFLQAGVDDLFDPRPSSFPLTAQGSAGLRLPLGPALVTYDLLVPTREVAVPVCNGAGTRQIGALHVQQHAATLTWDSPCRCFKASVLVRRTDCGDTSFSASFVLNPGGSFGAVR
jgi:LPS-assembly protein